MMSRTNKDKPVRIRFERPFYWTTEEDQPKKRKTKDIIWHWLDATPSWWTRLFMNRPQRRKSHLWERDVQKITNFDDLEDIDKPNVGKKPHKYYW